MQIANRDAASTPSTLPKSDPSVSASDPSARRRRLTPWLLVGAVLAATAYPPAMSLHREGLQGAFRYFAADAFYYLSVADHSTGQSFFTFDGTHPTNGFHPLWQLYLERSFWLLGLEAGDQVTFVAISSLVLVALGTALFALVLLRLTRRPWLALLGAVPGIYYLLVPTLNAHHFAQWSFANGMESPLSIFFFGLLLTGLFIHGWLDERAGDRRLVVLSVVLTAIVLSRLDDVFVFVPFVLFAALTAGSRSRALRRIVALTAVPTVAIGTYLVYNLLNAESMLPSSGAAKTQPLWALLRNLYALWTTTLPFADPLGREAVAWESEAWRILQMLVPAAAAACWLLARPMSFRPGVGDAATRRNGLIGLLAVYVLAKAGYNFAMVGLWHQGQWYYPLSIMTVNLIGVTWLASALDHRRDDRAIAGRDESPTVLAAIRDRWPASAQVGGLLPTLAAVFVVLVSANAFVDLKQSGRHQARSFEFWLERDATRYLLQETCPDCGVLAFDDGIVAYSLEDTPTLNGLGLVMDEEARSAQTQGQLLEVAWSRGHRVLASVNYEMAPQAYSGRERLRESLGKNRHLDGQDLDEWDFEVAFRSPSSGVSFVRFEPRQPPATDPWAAASQSKSSRGLSRGQPGTVRRPGHVGRPKQRGERAPATAPAVPPPPPATSPARSGAPRTHPG